MSRSLRVAIVAGPVFAVPPHKYGGTEQVVHNLIKGLIQNGHEPILFGTGDSKVECKVVPIVDKAILYPKTRAGLKEHLKKIRKIDKTTRQKIKDHLDEIDIIHSHGLDIKKFAHVPNVTTIHRRLTVRDNRYFKHRRHLPLISISKSQQRGSGEADFISVVYNGLDTEEFPVIKKPSDYLCFLGRFEQHKNPHLAIKLALKVGIPIKIAGKVDFHGGTYFDREIKPYLKHPLVEFLGELGFEDKVELISKARVNLHPAGWREPFGLDVIEAGYCGTPTLALHRGSMPELIKSGKTGELVNYFPGAVKALDKCFKLDRGEVAMSYRNKFNHRKMADEYINVYKKVLKSHKQ